MIDIGAGINGDQTPSSATGSLSSAMERSGGGINVNPPVLWLALALSVLAVAGLVWLIWRNRK